MLAAVALSAVSFAGQAESRVTVPFDFEAGGRMMPAGDYELKMNETASTLKNLDGRGSVFLSPIPGGADGSFSNVTLMFTGYGKERFLRRISEGTTSGKVREFGISKRERAVRESAANQSPAINAEAAR